MARPNKAKSGARRRWKSEKAIGVMKMRITSTLKRKLCLNHFFLLNDKKFERELAKVADIMNNSLAWAEEAVFPFSPEEPDVITLKMVHDFAEWLRSGRGEPLRYEGLQWCDFLRMIFRRCSVCRGGASLKVDVPKPVVSSTTKPRLIEKGESSAQDL